MKGENSNPVFIEKLGAKHLIFALAVGSMEILTKSVFRDSTLLEHRPMLGELEQCDQMVLLFFNILAICNNEN